MPTLSLIPDVDNAKRRQIMDGARKVFLTNGFEGASMNDIARSAGVSKGTLYVYFESKELLFASIVAEERAAHMSDIFAIDTDDREVERVLARLGQQLAEFLCEPRVVATMRVVMGISARMPEIGLEFYERGPCYSRGKLAGYLDARVATGELVIPDTSLAASQFLEMSHGVLLKPIFFGERVAPAPERVKQVVDSAVKVFMAAYGRPAAA